MIIRKVKVTEYEYQAPINYVAGATEPDIQFQLTDYEIPSGATGRVYVGRSDGTFEYTVATISGNTVTVAPTSSMFSVKGAGAIQVTLYVGNEVVKNFAVPVYVHADLADDAAHEGSDVTGVFQAAEEEALADFQEQAEQIVDEVIESIPADYTELTEEVDELNERLDDLTADIVYTEQTATWTQGRLQKEAGTNNLVAGTSTKYAYSSFITAIGDEQIRIADGYSCVVWKCDYNELGHQVRDVSTGYTSENVDYEYDSTYKYLVACVKRTDNADITTEEANQAVIFYKKEQTIFATKQALSDQNTSLTNAYTAADAVVKAEVDDVSETLENALEDKAWNNLDITWALGQVTKSNNLSVLVESNKYAYSGFVPVSDDTTITIADGYIGFAWYTAYNEFGHAMGNISSGYNSGTVTYDYNPTFPYIIICVKRSDSGVITTTEAKNAVVISEFGKTIFATKERVEQIAESTGSSASNTPTKGQVCYLGDTKSNSGYICNAIAYDDGVIIAARSNGTVVRIGYSGTEETLLSLTGSTFDWRCLWMDSNENVYASPHASLGEMNVADRGLYRLAKGGSSFTKVLSLYDSSSQVTTETQNNDDTIWTMCEDADGDLYAGVYAHTVRANPAIYKSTDGGLTWTYVFNFNTAGLTTNGKHIHTIIFSKWQNALYCIVGEVNTIFKSTDGSETWTDLHVTLTVKGSSMFATEYGIFIGSDGAYNCDIDILYPDDTTHKKVYRGWANTVFAIRQSDVTGILYAFTKIDSSVNSLAYYPPVAALTDPDEITAWLASEDATHKADWQAYYNSVIDIYPDDAIRPQHYSIIASRDGGMTWSPVKVFSCVSTAANGCWTTGFFINGECLTGRMENGASIKPVVISEGKHKYVSGGCDLDGEIFVRTNQSAVVEVIG